MIKSVITLLLIAITLLVGCNSTEKQKETENSDIQAQVQEQEDDLLSTQWKKDIQLNNGAKWAANLETTQGVKEMQNIIKDHATSTIEEYHHMANQLNEVKNTVVQECTMKGASHDNLHIWLYPLIEKINALAETNNLDEATSIKLSIEDNLNAYTTFFQ